MSDVTNAIAAALDRVDFAALAAQMRDSGVERTTATLDDAATDQFVRAFQALMREALEGRREQRDLVMDAAVPALVARGSTVADLLRSHVAFFVALAPRLVEAVQPAGLRDEAAAWLAEYAAEYVLEVTERAEAAQA